VRDSFSLYFLKRERGDSKEKEFKEHLLLEIL